MDFNKAYGQDDKAAKNGKWLVTKQGFDVKVAKLNNPNFRIEVVKLQKPHLPLLRSAVDSSELENEITVEAMAKTILKDWKAEDNGVDVPYTWELGKQYMLASDDFKEDVSVLAVDRTNFKEDIAEK